MKSQIRRMQLDDVDVVYSIERVAHLAPWGRDIIYDCVFVGYDCRVLELIKEGGKEIAGYAISRYESNQCHVLNLCITPLHQNKGYGRLLLQTIIDTPLEPSTTSVLLEVRPSNKIALRMYQKMGFLEIGTKKDYYCDEQGIEDGIVLLKSLTHPT